MTIDIRRNCYAMASTDGINAEITLYGDIYEQQPVDWFGDPIDGQYVLMTDFLEDLEKIKGCKSLLVRINSYGGDAGVANTIHNRLRDLSREGCKVTCVVDGVAMSGGSLIMCACDTVRVNPNSLIMIHKGWSFLWGGYNADELRDAAKTMDVWDKMQVEIYKRKTGLSETVLLQMMAETTYMTGNEAIEKGFADEIIEDAAPLGIAASADGRSLFVRGHSMHLAPGMFAPDFIPTVTPEDSAAAETVTPTAPAVVDENTTPDNSGNDTEGGNPMSLEELRAQQPELVQQIEEAAAQTAVANERARLQGIDEVATLFPTDLVAEAKYGEKPCNAAELSLKAAQAAAKAGSNFLSNLTDDAKASGTDSVPAPAALEDSQVDTPEALYAAGKAASQNLNKSK